VRLRWFIPIALLFPFSLEAKSPVVGARVATITINPREVPVHHLRPEFESDDSHAGGGHLGHSWQPRRIQG
jgi:hypothetical protein